jgi:hypothetical protein
MENYDGVVTMPTYHKDIFLPEYLLGDIPEVLELIWTNHAKDEAIKDKYSKIPIINRIHFDKKYVVEYYEIKCGYKILIRIPYNDRFDMCLILLNEGNREFVVKTVWMNMWNDNHKTLRKEKYVFPNWV